MEGNERKFQAQIPFSKDECWKQGLRRRVGMWLVTVSCSILTLAQSWDASDLIFLTPLVRARIKPVLSWRITCGDLIFHVWRYTEYWEAVCCLHSQSGWNGRLCHYYLASGSFVAARSGQLASGAATSPSPRHHPAWGHHHCAVASSLLSHPRHFAKDQLAAYSLAPFLWTSLSPPSVERVVSKRNQDLLSRSCIILGAYR